MSAPLPPLARAARALLPLLLTAGCASVRTEGQPPPLSALATWAWKSVDHAALPHVAPDGTGLLVHEALEQELGALGLREVPATEASMLVSFHVWVETRVRTNDPYFSLYAAEQVELGTVSIDLTDPRTGALAWRGSDTHELRVTAVLAGPFDQELTPRDAERRWRIRESVARIVRELRRGG